MAIEHNYLVNGNFDQAISPFDRGFSYGDGIFRTLKIVNGLPQHWPQHYQKLVADCAVIGIVCPSAELLMSDFLQLFAIDATLNEAATDKVAVAKIIITRGESKRGYAPPAITTPMRVILKSAMRQYADVNYAEGVRLHVCETKLAAQPKLAGIKHLNRLENVMARMEWQDETHFDGLMLDQQDNVIECTMSNIFARFNDTLVTPDLSQCGVAGITRQAIVGLSGPLNLKIEITQLSLQRLIEADEVIICNSLYGAFQVRNILNTSWSPQTLAKKIRNLLAYD